MTPLNYLKPTSIGEAIAMKASAGPTGKYIAGGTNLFDLMKLHVETPAVLVDLTGIRELQSFDTQGGEDLSFGALARMAEVAEDSYLKKACPVLVESLWKAASQQIRNMASVGGNLLQRTRCAYFRGGAPYACNKRVPGSGCSALEGLDRGHAVIGGTDQCIATYPGDWAVALTALDARIDVAGPNGRRSIPLASFYRGAGSPAAETALEADELILRIRVPKNSFAGAGSTFHKVRDRASFAFALASAAVVLRMDGLRIARARVALGGLSTAPLRAVWAEQALKGKVLNEATARQAAEAAFCGAVARSHNAFKIPLGIETVADALLIAGRRARA